MANRLRHRWTCFLILRLLLSLIVVFTFATPVLADPPPWAPAHGYYKEKGKGKIKKDKHRHNKDGQYDVRGEIAYGLPPLVVDGRCNREQAGRLTGGVVGGVLGSRIGAGDGRVAATILGSVLGYMVGGNIGRSMDDADHLCTGQALEYGHDYQSTQWVNPDTHQSYKVTPTVTYPSNNEYCREFITTTTVGNQQQQIYGSACRQQDGSWKMSSQPAQRQ